MRRLELTSSKGAVTIYGGDYGSDAMKKTMMLVLVLCVAGCLAAAADVIAPESLDAIQKQRAESVASAQKEFDAAVDRANRRFAEAATQLKRRLEKSNDVAGIKAVDNAQTSVSEKWPMKFDVKADGKAHPLFEVSPGDVVYMSGVTWDMTAPAARLPFTPKTIISIGVGGDQLKYEISRTPIVIKEHGNISATVVSGPNVKIALNKIAVNEMWKDILSTPEPTLPTQK